MSTGPASEVGQEEWGNGRLTDEAGQAGFLICMVTKIPGTLVRRKWWHAQVQEAYAQEMESA